MENNSFRVVVADDEVLNLEILVRTITDAGYHATSFDDGDTALQYIKANPERVDIIILDKIMPRMNGLDVLKQLKAEPSLKNIPIILQTGDVGIEQLKEGLQAGAYYYLSKPFDPEMLISLVNAAARDCVMRNQVLHQLKNEKPITTLLKEGLFEVRTVEDAYKLSAAISYHAIRSDDVNLGISALILNAIEHGNLSIGYEEKNFLLHKGTFADEVARRINMPENINKLVKVTFDRRDDRIVVIIEDQGRGFDWQRYMNYDPIRLTDLNGRGIASANIMRLGIEYMGTGNKVKCQFEIAKSQAQTNTTPERPMFAMG